jgi:hypothetical protein
MLCYATLWDRPGCREFGEGDSTTQGPVKGIQRMPTAICILVDMCAQETIVFAFFVVNLAIESLEIKSVPSFKSRRCFDFGQDVMKLPRG